MKKMKLTVFLLALIFTVLMMPLTAAYAATALNTELITNGGAESANISGWTDETGQNRWSSSTAYSNWANPAAGSKYFFLYNPSMDYLSGTMSQVITLTGTEGSGLFADISAGNVSIKFSISMFQGLSADNEAKAILEEYAANGTLLKTSQVTNTTSSGTAMGTYQINTQLNPGTRKFKVILSAVLTKGGYAQFDQVSLKLADASAGNAPVFGNDFPASGKTDAGVPYTVNFTISDADPGDLAKLKFSASSTNVNLIPASNITVSGSGGSRTLTIVPAGNLSGEADITVVASDGTKSAEKTFHFIVNKVISMDTNLVENGNGANGLAGWSGNTVNITPTSSGFCAKAPDSSMSQDIDISKFSPLIDGGETVFMMSAGFPNAYGKVSAQFYTNIACTNPVGSPFVINNSTASLQQKIPANAKGVKITFSNTHWGYNNIEVRNISFQIINDFPKISPISAKTAKLSELTVPVYAYYTTANATLTAVSSNQAIVSNGGITVTCSEFNRSVSFTPLKNGNVTITLTLNDGSKSATASFDVSVNEPAKIRDVASPKQGFYAAGSNLDFTVHFNYPVTGGTGSKLPLTIGGAPAAAAYLSGTADSITYRYTIGSGDSGAVAVGTAIDDTISPINDMAGYKADTKISAGATGVTVVQAPQLTSTAAGGGAVYGDKITFTAALSCDEPLFGTVQFKANGTNLGSPVSVSGNTVSYEAAERVLNAGLVSISAEFIPSSANAHFANLASNSHTLTINQKVLSVEGFTAAAKTYDGTTNVSLSGGTLIGVIAGDDVSAIYPTAGTAAKKDAGTQGVTFAPIVLTGTDKDNYILSAQPIVSVAISPKPITAFADVGSKAYDGTISAAVSFRFASDTLCSGDTVNVSAAAAFDSKNVGTGKPVTLGSLTKSGADAGNYDISVPSGLSADIFPLSIEITLEPATKTFGASDPVFSYRITSGTLPVSESLTGKLSREAGEDIGEYAITQGTLTNENNPNYAITFVPGAKLTVTAAPVVDAELSPGSGSFDRKTANQADVQTSIAWGSATGVTDVKAGGTSIGSGNYSVSGNTLTIKKEYLAAQTAGSLVLTVFFDQGSPVTLTIAVTDTTPPTISPISCNYDLNDPDDVTTAITWRNAASVTEVVCGTVPLTSPDTYTVSGSVLTITKNYLSGLTLLAGDTLVFNITFDTGDTAVLTVHVVNGYVPSSNADLSSLSVNGTPVSGFDAGTTTYNVELPYGSSGAIVTAEVSDPNAGCSITQASSLPGSAEVTVTAEDKTTKTYTINFTIAAPSAISVTDITVIGTGGAESIQVGGTLQMLAEIFPENAANKNVTWSLSGSGAEISADGLVTGTAAGSVTVRATAQDGSGVYGEKSITINAVPVTIYTITFDANGGSVYEATAQTGADGRLAILPAPARSGYTFDGWFTAAAGGAQITAGYVFTANTTIYAHWTPSGSFDGSTSSAAIPEKHPDQPVTTTTSVTASSRESGIAGVSIPDGAIADAIAKAQHHAQAQGKTVNGIAVGVNVTMPQGTVSLSATLSKNALQNLVSAGVSSLEINGAPASVSFDLKTLKAIQSQSSGDVTISITSVKNLSSSAESLIGTRPVYDISVSYAGDGKAAVISSFDGGIASIFIPYTPDRNEAVGCLFGVYVDGSGSASRIPGSFYDANAGGVLIPAGHFSVYGVGYAAPSAKFTDTAKHWARDSIDYVVGRGLFVGTSQTSFSPDKTMTRGMLVTVLGRLAGADTDDYKISSFTDVEAGSAFHPYIEWAYKNGITQGIGNNQFAPNRAVTREEIALIFSNFAKSVGYTLPIVRKSTAFTDNSSIGDSYQTAAAAMQQAGIMEGDSDHKFNPKSNAARAEVSAMLHRYIKLTITPSTAQNWALNDDGQYMYYKDGKALTGWQTIGGAKYYFYGTGALQTGWVKDGSGWRYYLGNKMITGWQNISGKSYYFTKDGLMAAGKWLEINGKWHYFYADGSLAKNTKIDGCEVDENGIRKTK